MKIGEVSKLVGLPKQRIHEYEQAGIALRHDPAHTFEYTEEDIQRLWLIKFYKELGYTVPQMKKIFLDPKYDVKVGLAIQLEELKHKKKQIEEMIERAETYYQSGLTPGSLFSVYPAIRSQPYAAAQSVFDNLGSFLRVVTPQLEESGEVSSFEELLAAPSTSLPEGVVNIDESSHVTTINVDALLSELTAEEKEEFKKLYHHEELYQKVIKLAGDYIYYSVLSIVQDEIEHLSRDVKKGKCTPDKNQELAESIANTIAGETLTKVLHYIEESVIIVEDSQRKRVSFADKTLLTIDEQEE